MTRSSQDGTSQCWTGVATALHGLISYCERAMNNALCDVTLTELCNNARRASVGDCLVCSNSHQSSLKAAQCSEEKVHQILVAPANKGMTVKKTLHDSCVRKIVVNPSRQIRHYLIGNSDPGFDISSLGKKENQRQMSSRALVPHHGR